MTFREALTKAQTELSCSHYTKLGEACDADMAGWTTCGCAVMAMRMKDADGEIGSKTKE
jgi:hypothetical protein